jgi:hypothetical protein
MDDAVNTCGRFIVERHWNRSAAFDLAENPPPVAAGPYDTREQAQAAADRLNNPPRPATQDALFDDKEVAN